MLPAGLEDALLRVCTSPEGTLLRTASLLLLRAALGKLPDTDPEAEECGDGSEILFRSGASAIAFPGVSASGDSEARRAAAA